ncbi:GatB/YqeY domain-containing protein [Terrilactibacillus sp. BCM23-1]|uniref:GatB/YqeY domain-containing protein n=1 Tax=Terrilactibacillus tamarindi TaxID=2599694 RepID=A0A6N8CS49_9BACI|nr:GatB/YqeY domain-containing protein [Terrilactibacillus tamarindi]MTT32510.1 GatB/YqeY domain-containing protein [Terrilactibacillus tamarindi]
MSLLDRLNQDLKQAMRDRDKVKLSVIRMIKTSITNESIKHGKELSDDDVLTVLSRELKQRKDSLQEFENAGRQDLIEGVQKEIEVVNLYMPEQLSKDDLQTIIDETISEIGAVSKSDMGKVMSALMPKVKGKADGKLVSSLVQSRL